MIEELKGYWPIIVQYPWEFLWVFVTGLTLGAGAPALWRWFFPLPTGTPREPGILKKLWGKITAFRPNALQIECIKVLRMFDTMLLTPDQVATAVNKANSGAEHPLSDVTQALGQLVAQEWADWQLRSIPGRWGAGSTEQAYHLVGRGLDYARKKKYPVFKRGDTSPHTTSRPQEINRNND